MSIEITTFKPPRGSLTLTLFPSRRLGETLDERLDAWLTEADEKTALIPDAQKDQAQVAYVYYKAYADVVIRMSASALKTTMDGGDTVVEFSKEQINFFKAESQKYLEEYLALVPTDVTETPQVGRRTQFVKTQFVW